MLKDPAVAAAYAQALPGLTDSAKKLDWFYQRHAAWDERVNLLPVYKLDRK
jgi:hypothetical protein